MQVLDVATGREIARKRLAREAELCYATVAMVTDFDCWHPDHDHVDVASVIDIVRKNSAAAGRLIGNVFGTSNIVWASIIGLILIYLTLGYFLGGKWADQNPTAGAMYRILAWGAFTLGLVPFIAGPVLRSAATAFETLQVGILGGSFVAVSL